MCIGIRTCKHSLNNVIQSVVAKKCASLHKGEAMNVMTVKQLADEQGVTYESIRRLLARHMAELEGHIHEKNRVRYLDEYAVDFLKSRRRESPIVVKMDDRGEEIENLTSEVAALRDKLAAAQAEIMALQKARIADGEKILALTEETKQAIEDRAARKYAEDQAEILQQQHEEDLARIDAMQDELSSYVKSWFGFYRKRTD